MTNCWGNRSKWGHPRNLAALDKEKGEIVWFYKIHIHQNTSSFQKSLSRSPPFIQNPWGILLPRTNHMLMMTRALYEGFTWIIPLIFCFHINLTSVLDMGTIIIPVSQTETENWVTETSTCSRSHSRKWYLWDSNSSLSVPRACALTYTSHPWLTVLCHTTKRHF